MPSLTAVQKSARALIRRLWIMFLFSTGLLCWAERQLKRRGATIVLTFHRVLHDQDYAKSHSPRGMAVKAETFDRFLRWATGRFNFVDLSATSIPNSVSPTLRLALTFDDGWQDNYDALAAIAHLLPITIFVCPACLGREQPFWPERVTAAWHYAANRGIADRILQLCSGTSAELMESDGLDGVISTLKSLPPADRDRIVSAIEEQVPATAAQAIDSTMTWAQVSDLARRGVNFGSHTETHEILPNLCLQEAVQQIVKSKEKIEDELGRPCLLFSYPDGQWSPAVRDAVSAARFALAFSNQSGAWVQDSDRYTIPRVNIWEGAIVGVSGRFSS